MMEPVGFLLISDGRREMQSNPTIYVNGRVGTNIEIRDVGSSKVARFRVVTNDRRKNDQGIWEDVNTSGWNIAAWDKLASKVAAHLEKGDPVMIYGRIFEDTWVDGEGNKRFSTEIRAEDIGLNILLAK